MTLGSGEKSVIYRLDIIFSITGVSEITCSARGIFIDIHRGILVERFQTSHPIRKLKNGNGWLFLCDNLVEISEEIAVYAYENESNFKLEELICF